MEAVTIVPARASFWVAAPIRTAQTRPVVEPIDPVERREFHHVETATGLVTVLRISHLLWGVSVFCRAPHVPYPQHQQRGLSLITLQPKGAERATSSEKGELVRRKSESRRIFDDLEITDRPVHYRTTEA